MNPGGSHRRSTSWRRGLDGSKIDAVEIANLGQANGGAIMLPGALSFWDRLCAEGHHAAALGGSDDHHAGTSTGMFASKIGEPVMMVFAEELSTAGILQGTRNNRTAVKLRSAADPMVDLTAEPDAATSREGDRARRRARARSRDRRSLAHLDRDASLATRSPPGSSERR
jgi:hypothetical protein